MPETSWSDTLHRLLFGQMPAAFVWEAGFRALVLYLCLNLSVRLMGKRLAAQLTLAELTVVISLGAAIGAPMQTAGNGILPAIFILIVAMGLYRSITYWAFRSGRFEAVTIGKLAILFRDGRLLFDAMKETGISREQVFAALRGMGIKHLGEVQRVYLEASGNFTLYKREQQRPGISVIPRSDTWLRRDQAPQDRLLACGWCGALGEGKSAPCKFCAHDQWEFPVLNAKRQEMQNVG